MASWISIAQLVLLGLVVVLLLWLALRRGDTDAAERLERNLRADVQDSARGTRGELSQSLATFQQTLLAQAGDVARTQNEQIDSFRTQLAAMQQMVGDTLATTTQALAAQTQAAREAQDAALHRFGQAQAEQLRTLADSNDKRVAEMRQAVEDKLAAIQADNGQRLEQMRATVDEKLHGHARAAPGRELQAGGRPARPGAPGPGRDADAGARCRARSIAC